MLLYFPRADLMFSMPNPWLFLSFLFVLKKLFLDFTELLLILQTNALSSYKTETSIFFWFILYLFAGFNTVIQSVSEYYTYIYWVYKYIFGNLNIGFKVYSFILCKAFLVLIIVSSTILPVSILDSEELS